MKRYAAGRSAPAHNLRRGPKAVNGHAPKRRTRRAAPPTVDWSLWGAARDGARVVLTRLQVTLLTLIGTAGAALLIFKPRIGLIVLVVLVTSLYMLVGIHKAWLLVRGELQGNRTNRVSGFGGTDYLPVYTVLVPLHREAKILPVLLEHLCRLDYPVEKLEILLLIETDDDETQAALRECSLPSHIRPTLMPPGQPRTKPRALNVGLHQSHGKYIVIYDAEDRPAPDQLRRAVAAFRASPPEMVGLQARLSFYNRYQSLLTRMFSVEYAVLFDQLLPGLAQSADSPQRVFVPLGGTSNHFRVDVLKTVGGWDPFNVTEDCDLGMRLSRAGLVVGLLDSVTWEEAVTRVKPWIRQRSRWVKGFLQTYLVHMREPLGLWKQIGTRPFVDFQMLVGGSCFVLLLNPLMWALTLFYAASKGTAVGGYIESIFPSPLYYPALLSMVFGNFLFFYGNAYVCVRHNLLDLTRYSLLTPLYWVLMSIGAWAGLLSLVRNPFYWAKTEHGVSLSTVHGHLAVLSEARAMATRAIEA